MVDGDGSFKRPGAVPFNWEIRPGVPKAPNLQPDDDSILLQPPKELPPLRIKPSPSSSSSSSISDFKNRPVSPFAPPSSFKLKSSPDSVSHSSRPPPPYFLSSSPRAKHKSGATSPRCFPTSLFGSKKSKSSDVKKTVQESTSSESDNFYESESTFSRSEDSSRGSVSTTYGSPKSSFSSRRGSPMKRRDSELGSTEEKTMLMMARYRFG